MKRVLAGSILVACSSHGTPAADPPPAAKARLQVTSPAFAANGEIPSEHTCEGADTSPPLAWTGAPAATRSFALIVDDPDAPDPSAPKQTWVHWVVANIPASVTSIAAGHAPDGARVGANDWDKTAWGGPCPPIGRHRYFFKLYALDAPLGEAGMHEADLLKAIDGHVIAYGELVGTYAKKKP